MIGALLRIERSSVQLEVNDRGMLFVAFFLDNPLNSRWQFLCLPTLLLLER